MVEITAPLLNLYLLVLFLAWDRYYPVLNGLKPTTNDNLVEIWELTKLHESNKYPEYDSVQGRQSHWGELAFDPALQVIMDRSKLPVLLGGGIFLLKEISYEKLNGKPRIGAHWCLITVCWIIIANVSIF